MAEKIQRYLQSFLPVYAQYTTQMLTDPTNGFLLPDLPAATTYFAGGLIPYLELVEGFKETITPDTVTAEKTVDVPWDRRREFVVTMRGLSYYGAGVTFASLTRYLPQPFSVQYLWLRCTAADLIMPYGGHRSTIIPAVGVDSGDIVFETARYRLTFTALKYDLALDATVLILNGAIGGGELYRYIERDFKHSADNIPIPSGSFKWVTAPNEAIQEGGIPKIFPTRQITYTWHEIPGNVMPTVRDRIRKCLGRVNAAGGPGFMFGFDRNSQGGGPRGFLPGTLLLIGAEEEVIGRRDAYPFFPPVLYYNVKFTFLERNNGVIPGTSSLQAYGWNYLYRGPSHSPQFQLVTHNGLAGGTKIYEEIGFDYLFNVNPAAIVS